MDLTGKITDILVGKIFIREAGLDDESAILEIRNHPENFRWFFQETPISPHIHRDWYSLRLSDAKFFTLVAEVNDQIIGTVYLTDVESSKPKVSISVMPNSKAEGVGGELLMHIIKRSKLAKLDSIIAEIKSTNLTSINLFSRNGFVPDDSQPRKHSKTQVEVVTLVLNLDES